MGGSHAPRRGELVPLLAELDDDEDEVLQAIAHELGGLMELVGGPDHASVLLVPLEKLAQVEEVAVRDRVRGRVAGRGALLGSHFVVSLAGCRVHH